MKRSQKTADVTKKVGLFDRVIERVSPSWAFRRLNWSRALKAARTYEAAEEGRSRKVRKSTGSADAVSLRSVEVLRHRARDLDENYDIAAGILDVLESKIVGSEILAHPMVMLEGGTNLAVDLNDHLSTMYREWAVRPEVTRQNSLGKTQRLAARSWIRDGECFVNHLDGNIDNLDHSTDVPYSIELLEADIVPMSLSAQGTDATDGHLLRYGILTDAWGKPVEYMMLKRHPGDNIFGAFGSSIFGTASVTSNDVKRVSASDVMHLKHVKRIHQTRGISALATVFNRLSDLKDYEESEQTAARIGAYVALAITKSADADPDASGSSAPREMDWMPGMIFDGLVEGEKVESIKNERPSNQIAPWREQCLKAASSGSRAGYSSISKDYNGTYSAQRQEQAEQDQHYSVATEEVVSMEVRPVYRRFVETALISRMVPRELLAGVDMTTILNAAYRGPSIAYIDPVKEINAELIGVQAGFFSKQSVQLKRGSSPMNVDAEIEQERDREKEKGIVTTSNPANKSTAAPAPAALPAADEEDEDAEAVDENGNRYQAIDGAWVPQHLVALAESMKE